MVIVRVFRWNKYRYRKTVFQSIKAKITHIKRRTRCLAKRSFSGLELLCNRQLEFHSARSVPILTIYLYYYLHPYTLFFLSFFRQMEKKTHYGEKNHYDTKFRSRCGLHYRNIPLLAKQRSHLLWRVKRKELKVVANWWK